MWGEDTVRTGWIVGRSSCVRPGVWQVCVMVVAQQKRLAVQTQGWLGVEKNDSDRVGVNPVAAERNRDSVAPGGGPALWRCRGAPQNW